jgi:hypothetical protein
MTDHSILRPAAPDLPFQAEARILTAIFTAIFVELPCAFRAALRAQQMAEDLYVLDSPGLAALGLERETLGRFIVEQSGMTSEKSE